MKRAFLFLVALFLFANSPWMPDVQVSQDTGTGNQNETTIGIFADTLVCGGWNDSRTGTYHVGFAASYDCGFTWQETLMYEPSYPGDCDPCIVVNDSGHICYVWLSYNSSAFVGDIYYTKSTDWGQTWGPSICVTSGSPSTLDDKPWAAVDRNNVFLTWREFYGDNALKFKRSTDWGQTWSSGVIIGYYGNGSMPFRGTDSIVYAGWGAQDVRFNKSTNMGTTWQGEQMIIDVIWDPPDTPYRLNNIPCFGTCQDRTILYVVFASSDLGSAQLDVFFSRSTDEGANWMTPIKINDTPAGDTTLQFYPWLAVDPQDRLHVVWHDTRQGSRYDIAQYYAYSTDGGLTWSTNQRVSDTLAYTNCFIGDYTATAAGSEYVYALWCDCRNGSQNPDIFFSKSPSVPSSPNIFCEKSENDAIITWNSITTDTLGNPVDVSHYVIYRDTLPSFIPNPGDSIGAVMHPETTYTDVGALNALHDYYYLVKAVDEVKNKSKRSNMGYVFHRSVNENSGVTADRNWVNLPWHSEYATCSLLCADLSPNAEAFNKVTNLDEPTQNQFSYFWHAGLAQWLGTNFAILPGHFYEFNAVKDTMLVVVGSHYPDSSRFLNENPGVTADRNWICLAYNAAYTTVSDITDELAPSGSPINKVTNLVDTTQAQFSWFYHAVLARWLGTDFAIVPGDGYEMTAIKDSTWNPTEWSNDGGTLLARKFRQSDIKMYLGQLNAPDRAPLWSVERRPVSQASREPIDLADARVYEPVKRSVEKMVGGRDPGISHLVLADLRSDEFENLVFTAYRPDRPYDALTENMVGSGIAWRGDLQVMWFDVANFKEPWEDGDEIVVIIEATKEGRGYFTVLNVRLELGNELQHVGEINLMPIPEPTSVKGLLSWSKVDNDDVIGYSLYHDDKRLNDRVIAGKKHSTIGDVNLKLVIKGGYETVYGSQGIQNITDVQVPLSYAFDIFPNPFIKTTSIMYALPHQTQIAIMIFDVTGRRVKTIVSDDLKPGIYKDSWSGDDDVGRDLAASVYFIQMITDDYRSHKKVISVR